jgi:hypothetical protein
MPFSSPTEFLSYLQMRLSVPLKPGSADPGFAAEVKRKATSVAMDIAQMQSQGLEMAVHRLAEEVLEKCTDEVASDIRQHIAIGTLDVGSINARIVRSEDGHFAILIHRGLMLFLSKAIKLTLAWGDPSAVTYCNRVPAAQISEEHIKSFLSDLIRATNTQGAPYGALIHLKDELSATRGWMLHAMEMFILCHELGHYINGDLNSTEDYTSFGEIPAAQEYIENRHHEKEFGADAAAFRIMCEVTGLTGNDRLRLMVPLIQLFNLLYMLGGRESQTHPHPLERTAQLFDRYFSPEMANIYAESYGDRSKIEALFSSLRAVAD